MNRFTKISLSLLVVATILTLVYPAVAERGKTDRAKDGFGMEISLDGRQPLTMAVRAKNERLALLPVNGERVHTVKVVPAVEGDSLKLTLLAVTDKLPELPTCEQVRGLKGEAVASYVAREGDVIRVSDFEKFGVAPFTVKVLSLAAVQTTCPDGACCCGGVTCYPEPGRCVQCGGCATCCRTKAGFFEDGSESEMNQSE